MKAIVSVSSKENLESFVEGLVNLGLVIVATEGTAKYLESRGIDVKRLSDFTGLKESKELKTLHPILYKWIYSGEVRVVAVIPYDFSSPSIENIDIGGISLIRAAAKNYKNVFVVFRREQYKLVLEGLKSDSLYLRKKLAVEAFRFTSEYDLKVSKWLEYEAP